MAKHFILCIRVKFSTVNYSYNWSKTNNEKFTFHLYMKWRPFLIYANLGLRGGIQVTTVDILNKGALGPIAPKIPSEQLVLGSAIFVVDLLDYYKDIKS